MGAVVEDIAGRRIDWDSTGVRCRVWLLPVGKCQWGGLMFGHVRYGTSYPACNCNVSNFCCGGSELILITSRIEWRRR